MNRREALFLIRDASIALFLYGCGVRPPPITLPTQPRTPEELNLINAQKLRELMGIDPTTSQAELAKIVLARQQKTDWLYRKLSDGQVITSPGNTANLAQFYNTKGQEITYGLDDRGENLIYLSYSREGLSVPQYSRIDYVEYDAQNNVGTVPMRTLTDGNNAISLYAPEDTLNALIGLWQPDYVKNFLRGYFGDPNSNVRKRLHLVFAPSSQRIQLGDTRTFYPTSEVRFANVLSQDSTSFEVVVNIPGVHSNSLLQSLPLNLNLGAILTNERLGFLASGYPQLKPNNNDPYFEAFSTIGEWEFLFDPEMRNMLMGGSDTYSNFLNPLAKFLEQTVPLEIPLISP